MQHQQHSDVKSGNLQQRTQSTQSRRSKQCLSLPALNKIQNQCIHIGGFSLCLRLQCYYIECNEMSTATELNS